MFRHPNSCAVLCSIKAIETYVAVARERGISLLSGYLFRTSNHQAHVVNTPHPLHPLSSTAKSRLTNLRGACVDAEEILRSFRSGFALTLAFFNSPLPEADVMPVLCRLVFLYNGTILPAKTG